MKHFVVFFALIVVVRGAVDLSGHWQSPECTRQNVGYTRTVSRFTSSTFSVETLFFSDPACTDLIYKKVGFGNYNLYDTYQKTLYVGTSPVPVTADFEVMSFGHAKVAIVPASPIGVALLNGMVATASPITCPDASRIGAFAVNEVMDMTHVQCTDLGTFDIDTCPTTRTLVYQDSVAMYIARGSPAKLCSASFATEAVFNDNNCAGDQPGCVVHSMQLLSSPDYVGEWELPCRSVNFTSSSGQVFQMSENGRITLSRTQLARKVRRYFAPGCPSSGGTRLNFFDYGSFQLSRQLAPGVYLAEYGLSVRSLLAPTEDSAVRLRSLLASDPVCLQEIHNITTGIFMSTTFATCEALNLRSQGSCPVHYTTLRVFGGQLYISDDKAGNSCNPDSPPPEVPWTRVTGTLPITTGPDFGTAVPQLLFSAESQARFLLFYFFKGLDAASATNDFSFLQSLLTDDFVLVYPGDPSFITPAGEYSSINGEPKYSALSRFLQAWRETYTTILTSQYSVLGAGDEYSAAVEFSQTVKNNKSQRTVRNVNAVWVFTFRSALISKIDVLADTLSLAVASCPSALMCGQSPPVTMITTISTANITTVTNTIINNNNVGDISLASPASTDGDASSDSTEDFVPSQMSVYVGLAAIILVLAILSMFGVVFIARNVTVLQLSIDHSRYSFRRRNSDEDIQALPTHAHVETSPVV